MKNWKTTLFGSLAGIAFALVSVFTEYSEILTAVGGVFTALAAYCAKDNNVTGGKVAQ